MCLPPHAGCRDNEDGTSGEKRERSSGRGQRSTAKILRNGSEDDSASNAETIVTSSTASLDSLNSFDSATSTGSDHHQVPKRRRQREDLRRVRFANEMTVYTLDQDWNATSASRKDLWYTRQDFANFRREMARKVTQKESAPGVGQELLQVYWMLRYAGYHQRYQFYYEDAELLHILSKHPTVTTEVPDDWLGMEVRAHLDIERDFRMRRAHLMEEVQRLQACCHQEQEQSVTSQQIKYYSDFHHYYDGFVWTNHQAASETVDNDAEKEYGYLICQTSRLTSHVSRLYALHVASLLAKSVAADQEN